MRNKKTAEEWLEWAKANYWTLPGNLSWSVVRRVVLLRDEYKCRSCGATEHLHVHHESYPNFDLRSLLTVCRSCHRRTSKGKPELSLSLREIDRIHRMRRVKTEKPKLLPVEVEDEMILRRVW